MIVWNLNLTKSYRRIIYGSGKIIRKFSLYISCRIYFLQSTRSLKPNYVQNGKVHFERLKHLNEELEFRRNLVPPQLPTLLSKKELLSRLSKRQEQIPGT